MKKEVVWLTANILMVAVLLLDACGPATTTTPTPTATPKPIPTLENTTWVLQSYGQTGNLKSVLTGTVTAVFDNANGQVTGFTGVNRYGGGYELKDNKLSIQGLTLTALLGPQPLLDQETEFLKLLQAAESYQIEDSQLQINCGQQVLIFAKKT